MEKNFYNYLYVVKKLILIFSFGLMAHAYSMERIRQLRKAASEGTGIDGLINLRPAQLTIPTSPTNTGPFSARIDDTTRTRKIWQVLQIIKLKNNPLEFRYDEKRELYVSSPITSPLSPEEIQRFFPREIDSYIKEYSLPLNFSDGRKIIYLPGLNKEDDGFCEFGCFEYRISTVQNPENYNLPESVCSYRRFNPIRPEEFPLDDILLQRFDQNNSLVAPCWSDIHALYSNLQEVQRLLFEEQTKLTTDDESTFPLCVLKNFRTLLIAQAKIINESPKIATLLKETQAQINRYKAAITASQSALADDQSRSDLNCQISRINEQRQLQVSAILAGLGQQAHW